MSFAKYKKGYAPVLTEDIDANELQDLHSNEDYFLPAHKHLAQSSPFNPESQHFLHFDLDSQLEFDNMSDTSSSSNEKADRPLDSTMDTRAERRLVRKLDCRLLPCLFTMLVLNSLVRRGVSNARVQGLEADLNMSGTDFSTVVAIFSVGYILLQIPSTMMMTRVRPSTYLSLVMLIWGLVSGATALCHSFGEIVAVQFFLGFVEAPFFPCAVLLLSSWYTTRELAKRMAWLHTGGLVSGAFGGLLAAAIHDKLDDVLGIESWRWLFIICSAATVLFSGLSYFLLPDFPATTKWLNNSERQLAISRLIPAGCDAPPPSTADVGLSGLLTGFKLAIKDPKLWLLAAMFFFKSIVSAVVSFLPTIIRDFGLSPTKTLLFVAPPYIFAALFSLGIAWLSDRRAERCYHIVFCMLMAMIAFLYADIDMNHIGRYISMFFMLGGVFGCLTILLAWIGSSIPSPLEKKAAAMGITNCIGNIGQVLAPYMYLEHMGPRYAIAMTANTAICALVVVLTIWLMCILKNANREAQGGTGKDEPEGGEMEVKTAVQRRREAKYML